MRKLTLIVLAINNLVLGAAVWVIVDRLVEVELLTARFVEVELLTQRMSLYLGQVSETIGYLYYQLQMLMMFIGG